jgi:hypothetical protein
MSGLTIDEQVELEVGAPKKLASFETMDAPEIEEQPSKSSEMFGRIMTAETGEGSIGDYLDHPMNFNNSLGLAQMLRGFTGIVGNLKLAIIDVIIGALRFSREKKGVINNGISSGGDLPS